MSSSDLIEILAFGFLAPAAAAFALGSALKRLLPTAAAGRWSAAAGLVGAFGIGYALLPEWAEVVPSRHWHWLPYLAAFAAVTGAAGRADGVSLPERWLLQLLVSVVAAWLLVPTWPSLQPARTVYIPVLAAYLFLLAMLLQPLSSRIPAVRFPALLGLAALVLAACIATFVSLNYARVAGIAAGGLGGIVLAAWWNKDLPTSGTMPAYAVLAGGTAFVGAVEPQQPLLGLLLFPAAPLALWLSQMRPLKSLSGPKSLVAQTVLVLALLIGAALVLQFDLGPSWGESP